MEEINGNAQVQPTPETPAAAGPNAAELQARIAELERANEGRLRDLQQERAKRQELEQRFTQPPVPPAASGVADDEVDKLVSPSVRREIAPMMRKLQELELKEALQYLAGKTGKTIDQIRADTELQGKLQTAAQEFAISGDLLSVTQKAYRAVELKEMEAKEAERARSTRVNAQAPMAGGAAPAPVSSRAYSASDFNGLSSAEYRALADKGGFKKNADGSFSYNPR